MDKYSKVVIDTHESAILRNNPLGDPHIRKIYTYLPPGYDEALHQKYPVLLVITGFTGTGGQLFNLNTLSDDLQTRMDKLIEQGKCPPALIVAPDCFTKVGGSQYLNSTATGNYEDYLLKEIIPFINSKYRTKNWGVYGKSSGGYGAMILGMRHPDFFKVLGCHSGDSNFELSYLPDFRGALNAFKKAGGPKNWLDKFWADVNKNRKEYHETLNALGMSAAYSPNPESPQMGIDFPFDLETGVFKPEVWKRWQDWDPVKMIPKYEANLRKLQFIFIDCGSRDEFALQWGARAMMSELKKLEISVHYEEFDDGHMSISYREYVSLPLLIKGLD